MAEVKKHNVINDFMNLGFGVVANIFLGLLTTPVITRVVDTTEYGKLAIFNTYSGLILSIVYFGLDQAIIRFFYDSDEVKDKKSLLKLCIGIPVLSSLIVLAFLYLLIKAGIIDTQFNDLILFLLCIEIVVSIWNKFSMLLLQLTFKTKAYSLCSILQKAVYCGLVIILCLMNHKDLTMLVIATVGSLIGAAIVATLLTKEYWNFNNIQLPNNAKEVIKYSLPFIIFSFVITFSDSIDKLVIERFCSDAELGIYTSAFTLLVIFDIVKTTFSILWKPLQTEYYVKNPDDPSFLQKGNRYVTIIMFFVGINVIMFKDILAYFLGASYREAAYYMPFLVIDSIMYIISETTSTGIEKSKKSYQYITASIIPCLVNVAFCFLLVPIIGAKGAAISRAITNITYFTVRTYLSNKSYYIDYGIKKIVIILLFTISFAYINTFYSIVILNIISYICIIVIFWLLYKNDIQNLIQFVFVSIKQKLN